jgi:hypothetical protein
MYTPVRPSAIVRGALGGTLILATPWARQAIPKTDRQGIADRVPDGFTLFLSARMSQTDWSVRLYDRSENPAEPVVELLHQRDALRAIEAVLERLP